jgi:hypothetical protein
MKAKVILINWALSFMGLCVSEPFWAAMVGAWWFIGSAALFVWADRKGLLDEFVKRHNLDEL